MSGNPPIKIHYNQQLAELENLLAGVNRPGDYFVAGKIETPLPQLTVRGAGRIAFPVMASQVKKLMSVANRAPYGKGEETIVDTNVRRVWQIETDEVSLSGKHWANGLKTVMEKVADGLGCGHARVEAELYKLLVYDEGSFFLPHRDTEKAEGMFGTLVVVLPSFHTGGELIVRHGGKKEKLNLTMSEGEDESVLKFAAFYADCEHEVKPITRGNRVCLVYNLIQKPAKKRRAAKKKVAGKKGTRAGRGTPALKAPDFSAQVRDVASFLQRHKGAPDASVKIVYLLEHEYTPAGLSFSGLKNGDRSIGRVLAEAAAKAGFALHVGIVHIEETGAASVWSEYGRYRHRRSYSLFWDDDDEDESEADDSDFEIIDVLDYQHTIDSWIDTKDRPAKFGVLPLERDELFPAGALDGEPPDVQRVTEATGNEGGSYERSYHRAALVLWPEDASTRVLLQGGIESCVPALGRLVKRWASLKRASTKAEAWQETEALARQLIQLWSGGSQGGQSEREGFWLGQGEKDARSEVRREMLALLLRMGNAELVGAFLSQVLPVEFTGSEAAELVKACRLVGPELTEEALSKLIEARMEDAPAQCTDVLSRIVKGCPAGPWTKAKRALAAATVSGLRSLCDEQENFKRGRRPDMIKWRARRYASPKSFAAKDLGSLVASVITVEDAALAHELVDVVVAFPVALDPAGIVVPALKTLAKSGPALQSHVLTGKLWEHAMGFLLDRSEFVPEEPKDWKQSGSIPCQCPDCAELKKFASNPVEQVHRFSVRKDRRQHLHQVIEAGELDMTHVTERRGSPQTLVCVKTRKHYLARCQQRSADVNRMKSLVRLMSSGKSKDVAALLARATEAAAR